MCMMLGFSFIGMFVMVLVKLVVVMVVLGSNVIVDIVMW